MRIRLVFLAVAMLSGMVSPAFAEPTREHFNWMMNCQGCHGATGRQLSKDTPALEGFVARFLSVEGGRDYLMRVPGVVNAPIPDLEVANLLTWMVRRMDSTHLPADFTPFTEAEVTQARRHPLITQAAFRRAELIEKMARTGE